MLLILAISIIIHLISATDNQCSQHYCTNNLLEHLAPLEIKYTRTENKCAILEESNEKFSRILQSFNQTLEGVKETVKLQQEIITQLKAENDQLKKTLEDQTKDVKNNRGKLILLENNTVDIEDRIERNMSSLIDAGSKVAFSVHLSHHITNLDDYQVLVFDQVNINEGGAYNTTSGMFECHVPGTYYFTVSILSYNHELVKVELVYNGEMRARIYAAGSTGSHGHDQGSNSVILSCKNGDYVWLRYSFRHGTNTYGHGFSHFAGFILWTE